MVVLRHNGKTLGGRLARTTVGEVLASFCRGELDDPQGLVGWASTHRALPVLFDMGGCLALRGDHSAVSFPWDDSEAVRQESDPRIVNLALLCAAERHAQLAWVRPLRGPSDVDCPHCGGTGQAFPGHPELESVRCYCGGLGWLPGP